MVFDGTGTGNGWGSRGRPRSLVGTLGRSGFDLELMYRMNEQDGIDILDRSLTLRDNGDMVMVR